MKKAILFISAVFFLASASSVWAQGKALEKLKQEGKNATEAAVATAAGKVRQTILERLKEKLPFLLPAGINQATITVGPGATLPTTVKVSKEGQGEITLNLTDKTNLLRKFGGKASLAELKVGDIVTARGKWQDSDKAVLEVRVLRDLSLQKRTGTFWGKIKSIDGTKGFVLTTANRGELSVLVSAGTKIVDRKERKLSFTDLVVDHRVRVTGLWDVGQKVITEVKTIKDWTIGPKVSPTASPSATPAP